MNEMPFYLDKYQKPGRMWVLGVLFLADSGRIRTQTEILNQFRNAAVSGTGCFTSALDRFRPVSELGHAAVPEAEVG